MSHKKKAGLIVVVVILLYVIFLILRSSLEYRMMSLTETLKGQIKEEKQVFESSLFESVDIQRSWYSLSPEDWTFIVTLSDHTQRIYHYGNREFVLVY